MINSQCVFWGCQYLQEHCQADAFFQKHLSKYRFKRDVSIASIQSSPRICKGLPHCYGSWQSSFTADPWKESSDPGTAPALQECERVQVRAAMLTWVNGRVADDVPDELLNRRSQTRPLQAHGVASSQGLAQVSANHSQRQRPALTYGPLGKQRHKGSTWRKRHSLNPIQRHRHTAARRSSKHTALFLAAISFLFQLVKCVSLSKLHGLSATPHAELSWDEGAVVHLISQGPTEHRTSMQNTHHGTKTNSPSFSHIGWILLLKHLALIDPNLFFSRTDFQLESCTLQKSTFQVFPHFSTRNTHIVHTTRISGYRAPSCPLIIVQLFLVNSSFGTLLTWGPPDTYSGGAAKQKPKQLDLLTVEWKTHCYPTSVFHTTFSEASKRICHFPGKVLPQSFKATYPALCREFKRTCTFLSSRQSIPAVSFQQSKSLHSQELTRE